MAESVVAGVAAADVLRGRFREQVVRYRRLVEKSLDTDGVLSEAETIELVELCEALKLPPDRFERDRVELMGLRRAESRLEETQRRNATPVVDVPQLEAELAKLSTEFAKIRSEAAAKCRAIETRMAETRREIQKETGRPRESTQRLEREVIGRRDGNPVMFRAEVEPAEWSQLLGVRPLVVW